MPELSRFCDIALDMPFDDVEKYHKPHFHAVYSRDRAVVTVDGECLEGALPDKQMRLVLGWAALREDELYKAWNNSLRYILSDFIAPLQ